MTKKKKKYCSKRSIQPISYTYIGQIIYYQTQILLILTVKNLPLHYREEEKTGQILHCVFLLIVMAFPMICYSTEKGSVLNDYKKITRFDKQAESIYFLIVDRFNDANKTNNHPMNRPDDKPKVDYQGGDIAGITQK